MTRRLDQILAASIGILVIALVWVVSGTLQERIIKVGDTAPSFAVTTETGKTVTPTSFGGKVLIVNFWATWCPPCIKETPSMNAFAKQFGPKGVVLLGVSVDRNADAYRKFLKSMNVAYETSLDSEANLSSTFGTFQYPETYVIDQSGKVIQKIIADQDWMDAAFLAQIQKLL